MAEHKMTFEVENGITKAKIDGVYMGGGKAAQVEANEEQIKDVIEDTVKANPELSGTEPNLEGLELSGDKYAIPQDDNSSKLYELTVSFDMYDMDGTKKYENINLAISMTSNRFVQIKQLCSQLGLEINTMSDFVNIINSFNESPVLVIK